MVQLFDDVFIDPIKISYVPPGLVNFITCVKALSEIEPKREYDLEIPQSHIAEQPTATRGRATEQ